MAQTWKINAAPTVSTTATYNINFTSNGNSYSKIILTNANPGSQLTYGSTITYRDDEAGGEGWVLEAYRKITFATNPSGALLTWLQSNARLVTYNYLKINNKIVKTLNSETVGSFNDNDIVIPRTGSSSETWVVNATQTFSSKVSYTEINFTTVDKSFTNIQMYNSTSAYGITVVSGYDYNYEYFIGYDTSTNKWGYLNPMSETFTANENARTWTFPTAPTGDLLTWLQANAVKQ